MKYSTDTIEVLDLLEKNGIKLVKDLEEFTKVHDIHSLEELKTWLNQNEKNKNILKT